MHEAAEVAAGFPMAEGGGDFEDACSHTESVNGKGHLDPKTLFHLPDRVHQLSGQRALPGEWGLKATPGCALDAISRGANDEPHPALLRRTQQNGDGHIGFSSDDRREEANSLPGGFAQVGVKKEQDVSRRVLQPFIESCALAGVALEAEYPARAMVLGY